MTSFDLALLGKINSFSKDGNFKKFWYLLVLYRLTLSRVLWFRRILPWKTRRVLPVGGGFDKIILDHYLCLMNLNFLHPNLLLLKKYLRPGHIEFEINYYNLIFLY